MALKNKTAHISAIIIMFMIMLLATPSASISGDSTDRIRSVIHKEFPGAVINETRQGTVNGRQITEVKFTSREGTQYEATVSQGGEMLHVEEEKGLPVIGGELSLGVGLRIEKDIYRGVDTEFQPVPFLRYENSRFSVVAYDAVDVAYRLIDTGSFAVALRGSLNLHKGYDPDDSDYLKGMDELDTLFGAGVELEWNIAGFIASLTFLQDISSEHDGQEVVMAVSRPFNAGKFRIEPALGVTWMSDKAVDYFYGVSASEARTDRPAYSPGSSYEAEAGVLIQRPIFGNFSLLVLVEFTMYGSAITDSPITERDYGLESAVGIAYAF